MFMIVTITRCDTIAVIIDNRDSIWIGNVIYEHYARSISVHYLHVITTKWLTEMTPACLCSFCTVTENRRPSMVGT